jgi:hypothetical protein
MTIHPLLVRLGASENAWNFGITLLALLYS